MSNAAKALIEIIKTHKDDEIVAFAKRVLLHHLGATS